MGYDREFVKATYSRHVQQELANLTVYSHKRVVAQVLAQAAALERQGWLTTDEVFAVVDAVEAYEVYVAKMAAVAEMAAADGST